MNIGDTEPGLWALLQRAGYSDRQIAGMTLETRLLHDLRLRGDNFLDTMELLITEFVSSMNDVFRIAIGNCGEKAAGSLPAALLDRCVITSAAG